MPDATDFSFKMVGLSTAYAALWGIDKGLEKISLDLIGVQPIMNWVAEDLKEAIMTAAVEQAVLHGIDYSENHLAAFLSRFKVPEHVTRSAMGAAHDFVEDVGVDTASQVGVAAMAGVKAGAWGALKGAGQGAVGGLVAGGLLGAAGGAVVGGLAQGVWEGGKEAAIRGASSPDAIAALNTSGATWILEEFATYMDVHREGAWRQLDDVIDRPLKDRGISSEKFWGGDLVRRYMKGTIKFLIKHTIVEQYKKTDYESRRRAMQYRLAIYAFSKCSSLGGTVTDLWGSAVDKAGELSELFKRTKDDGLDWKTTLEYKYSFIGDDTNIDELKAALEGLDEEKERLRSEIAELQGRVIGNKTNKKMLEASMLEKYGEAGSKIGEGEKHKAAAYEKDKKELEALNTAIATDEENTQKLIVNLESTISRLESKGRELEKAIDAYCGVSTKDLKAARKEVASQKLMILEADHMIGIFQGYIDEQAAVLKTLETAEEELKEAQRSLDQANKEVKKNKRDNRAQETVARSVKQAATIKARVDFLKKHIRDDFNVEDVAHKGGKEDVRKVIASLKEEITTLENEKKAARKALPKAEKALAEEEATFRKAIAGAVSKQIAQCTTLADDCVAESKNIIRLGMLVRDGYMEKDDYDQAISLIRLKLSELPNRDPRQLAFEKVISDFSYENLFAVGHRNTSTEIEADGKLTVNVFNTDIHGLDKDTESDVKDSFEANLVASFNAELLDGTEVQGFDLDENNQPIATLVDPKFVEQVDAGKTPFKLDLSLAGENPRVSGRLQVVENFDAYGNAQERDMSKSEKAVEKLRVMTGGDELMVAKATQILNLETAQSVLGPLKAAVIEGRNETGFDTKMVLKNEDNPEYIFQIAETPGQDTLVITLTARWEVEGHKTGDREHTLNSDNPSTVEASTQFVIEQGDLIKVATGNEIEVPAEGGKKGGWFGFGAKAETKMIPEIVDERQAPTCEFRSCAIIRTIQDTISTQDLGLGDKHPQAPQKAEAKDTEPDVVIADMQKDERAALTQPDIDALPQSQPNDVGIINDPVIANKEPSMDLRAQANATLETTLKGSFFESFGTVITDEEKVTEIEAHTYLIDVNNAFIEQFKNQNIVFSIHDDDARLEDKNDFSKEGVNGVIAPIIQKLDAMTGGDVKSMKVAMQSLTQEAADMLFTADVKAAIAHGRDLEGTPSYSFEITEIDGGLTIKTTAAWGVSGSDEKAQGTVEFLIREGAMKQVPVEKEIKKQGSGGWFRWNKPATEIISVFENQKQPPTLELVGLTVD